MSLASYAEVNYPINKTQHYLRYYSFEVLSNNKVGLTTILNKMRESLNHMSILLPTRLSPPRTFTFLCHPKQADVEIKGS